MIGRLDAKIIAFMNGSISVSNSAPESLRKELEKIRQESLIALRKGDYRRVGLLTTETARINGQLLRHEGS
jgi:hypothetical protein